MEILESDNFEGMIWKLEEDGSMYGHFMHYNLMPRSCVIVVAYSFVKVNTRSLAELNITEVESSRYFYFSYEA